MVAIGEIGLETGSELEMEVFKKQLKLAQELEYESDSSHTKNQ